MPPTASPRTAAIIGASDDPAKSSHQAVRRLVEAGYTVWPIHPSGEPVAGVRCYRTFNELPGVPDLVSMYVNPRIGAGLADLIAKKAPQVVILNPGADGEPAASTLRAKGLKVVEACTLVLISRGDPLDIALGG